VPKGYQRESAMPPRTAAAHSDLPFNPDTEYNIQYKKFKTPLGQPKSQGKKL